MTAARHRSLDEQRIEFARNRFLSMPIAGAGREAGRRMTRQSTFFLEGLHPC